MTEAIYIDMWMAWIIFLTFVIPLFMFVLTTYMRISDPSYVPDFEEIRGNNHGAYAVNFYIVMGLFGGITVPTALVVGGLYGIFYILNSFSKYLSNKARRILEIEAQNDV